MKHVYTIGIIGIGMVGAPLKRYFEEEKGYKRGAQLYLFDIDPKKGYNDDINKADIIFVAVPTPRGQDGYANLSAVESAFSMIGGEKIIVLKSTVPPGTTENLQKKYPQHKVLFSPEFLTERRAWDNFINPDRQIVGFTKQSTDAAYPVLSLLPKAPFMSPDKVKITATEAEIIKYGGNVYLARKVNLANILANLAETIGANYENIRAGVSADIRIGDSHLDVTHGGYRGFGGYCLPKDLSALATHLESLGLKHEAELLYEDFKFNEELLAEQGLTIADVSMHDHEWVDQKLKMQSEKQKNKN